MLWVPVSEKKLMHHARTFNFGYSVQCLVTSQLNYDVSGSVSFYFARFHSQLNGNMSKDIHKAAEYNVFSFLSRKRVSLLLNALHQDKMVPTSPNFPIIFKYLEPFS